MDKQKTSCHLFDKSEEQRLGGVKGFKEDRDD